MKQVISKYLLAILTSSSTSPPPSRSTASSTAGSISSTSSTTHFGVEATLQAISSLIDIFADENSPYDANFRIAKVLKGMSDHVRDVQKLVRGIDSRKSKPGRGGGKGGSAASSAVEGGGKGAQGVGGGRAWGFGWICRISTEAWSVKEHCIMLHVL